MIVAPLGQDASAMARLLQREGILAHACADPQACLPVLEHGAGTLLLTEEALELTAAAQLFAWLRKQPPWSELPVIILTSGGESRFVGLLDLAASAAGSVTLLERPMSPATLLRSVQVALRSRRRQYEVRDLLAEQQRLHDEIAQERKEVEAVLTRDKAELERLVAERTARLQELVGELEHFSYSITHDMRAPLRAMMAFSEAVQEMCADSGSEEQKRFLARISSAARRMDLLITDALNYSKAIRNELPLAPVDVGRLLRGMLDTYPELQAAHASIRVEGELPLVMGNEAGLTQCFSNLLGNAVKFAKPGQRAEVRVRAQMRDGRVRLWVEDNGVGISGEMLPRAFDMFARGASPQAGTGIGLALVRKVVHRMGGRVGVESEEGRGSRFWIELKPGEATPAAEQKARRSAKGGQATATPELLHVGMANVIKGAKE